jgi:hypothetical protein
MGESREIRLSEMLDHNGFSVHLGEYFQQRLFLSEGIPASKQGGKR